MKISYGVTVCNEAYELNRLLEKLVTFIRTEDEIVVLIDKSKATEDVWKVLEHFSDKVVVVVGTFRGNFARWKNKLNSNCTGDFIFQIDADELPTDELLYSLPAILEDESNSKIDLYYLPRENRVEGITEEDIQKWGWNVSGDGMINWPDPQGRIYRNSPKIKWTGKIHEKLTGWKVVTLDLIQYPQSRLIHIKGIEKQRKQNELYEKLIESK